MFSIHHDEETLVSYIALDHVVWNHFNFSALEKGRTEVVRPANQINKYCSISTEGRGQEHT